jgi:uncharacterized membrane protein
VRPILWLAIAGGGAASIAALYGHYLVLPGWLTGPEVCRLEDGGCAVLFRSPRSRLLGVPNALLGVILYALLAAGAALDWPPWILLVLIVPAVVMSVFLAWTLISNRHQCRICWIGHFSNWTLFLLFFLQAVRR